MRGAVPGPLLSATGANAVGLLVQTPPLGHTQSVRREAQWWLNTAEGDLTGARVLLDAGRFNLAAFHSQQAAEKALKAVLSARGKAHRGHAIPTGSGAIRPTTTTRS